MNTFIDSYAAFLIIFASIFVLAATLEWIGRKFDIKILRYLTTNDCCFGRHDRNEGIANPGQRDLEDRASQLEQEILNKQTS